MRVSERERERERAIYIGREIERERERVVNEREAQEATPSTPVNFQMQVRVLSSLREKRERWRVGERPIRLQGYLAHKKQRLPRSLQWEYA